MTRNNRRRLLAALLAVLIGAGLAGQAARAGVEQIAGSKGLETFGRESSIARAQAEELPQIAGSKAAETFGRESS
jgi:hypothetical protein